MKSVNRSIQRPEAASALLITLVMTGCALLILTGALTWAATNAKLTDRSNRYTRSQAAAEAATEKVLGQVTADFLRGGEQLVRDNLDTYRRTTPTTADSAYWADWEFNDASGHTSQTYVQPGLSSNYVVLNSTYAGLRGFVTTYTIVANAHEPAARENVYGGVLQQLDLARIPIFQFAMYTSGDMEVSCGQPFTVTGRVHSNNNLYVEPDDALTFLSTVTAVGNIIFGRLPIDPRGDPSGSVDYQGRKDAHQPPMVLPIGVTNTPQAVREITQPPPAGEDPNSLIGRSRYYNQVDLVVTVNNGGQVSATSGLFNNFATAIPTNQVALFVTAANTNNFYDWRENKTIRSIDINVGVLRDWSATNTSLRPALGSRDLDSIYVWDRRNVLPNKLGAVRVVNGRRLPARGLTVATASPLYVLGHYNQTNDTNLGTTNTITTVPASLVGDALTILSRNWVDANSKSDVSLRLALPTTVNAAILAGAVDTTAAGYGGGMENFPRFLESWGLANALTYNGSMVKMFPSLYATNAWGSTNTYDPPKRDWAYDMNFDSGTKLPPRTPSMQSVSRSRWVSVAPNQTTPPAN